MEQVKYFKLKIVTPEKIELLNDKVKFVKELKLLMEI